MLADLAQRMLERNFFRVDYRIDDDRFASGSMKEKIGAYLLKAGLSDTSSVEEDVSYYLHRSQSTHEAYDATENTIGVLNRFGRIDELSISDDVGVVSGLAQRQTRPFICFPKEVDSH